MRLVVLLLLAACGRSEIGRERATPLFREVAVDTAPGLSGLASDDAGGIWTIAERADRAYRITLAAAGTPAVETFAITGVPDRTDLEGIAWLGGSRFALGTEGRVDGVATVLLAERRGGALAITGAVALPAARIGVALPANHGAEGVCGGGDTILVAIEGAGVAGGKRYAPLVRLTGGEVVRTHRLWLTSRTGKISALDCTIAADGTAEVIAIERHFEVTKVLTFTVPPADGDLTPAIALDLGAVLNSRLNLEGIARVNGRVVAVTDNQWKTIRGPSLLLVFEPAAIGSQGHEPARP